MVKTALYSIILVLNDDFYNSVLQYSGGGGKEALGGVVLCSLTPDWGWAFLFSNHEHMGTKLLTSFGAPKWTTQLI